MLCALRRIFDCFGKLSHLVYSLADMGNFAGNVVLVINALASSHLDRLDRSGQRSVCSSLVTVLDSSVYLFDSGFDAGTDRFISIGICAAYKDSFLCGFNVSQVCIQDNICHWFTLARHGELT